jgi:hypothetical protein
MLKDRVAEFVSRSLNGRRIQRRKCKFIHDPLWGTIEISNLEAEILDTPLLQRLKQIHQTGFVYQTFPSARHTRFDHTLGVMHLAGRIAETLGKKFKNFADRKSIQIQGWLLCKESLACTNPAILATHGLSFCSTAPATCLSPQPKNEFSRPEFLRPRVFR